MPVHTRRSDLPASAEEAFAWHTRPGALNRLLPPWERIAVREGGDSIGPGARTVLSIGRGPLTFTMEARHGPLEPGRSFSAEQVRGPFAHWRHVQRFLPAPGGGCAMEDQVDWRMPPTPLGLLGSAAAGRAIARMFRHRHLRLHGDLTRHARYAGQGPLRVAVSGASGLVGTRLCDFLTSGGHEVLRLVRRPPLPEEAATGWDPAAGTLDPDALEGVDAVVHLSGESLASGRWNPARKQAILTSRIQATAVLCGALAGLRRKPRVLVSASAIGWYGDTGDRPVDENAPAGTGFLAGVCRDWEAATEPARQAGIRVVNLRTGMVLAGEGGALAKMALPFRLGLGGTLGTGRQYTSWIALEDLLGVIQMALFDGDLAGPVNAVAPEPLTNRNFTRALGHVLSRPTLAAMPAPVVRVLFGEMGQALLLEGQRALPARLRAQGFAYLYPTLEAALRAELGTEPGD